MPLYFLNMFFLIRVARAVGSLQLAFVSLQTKFVFQKFGFVFQFLDLCSSLQP